jgi:translin
VHLGQPDVVAARTADAERAPPGAGRARPFPAVRYAGFLHDAAKEYVEARATAALVAGVPVPGPQELGWTIAAWLNGLAEAASELRRHALDRSVAPPRAGRGPARAMDDVFGELVTIDLPDALTGGLRRTLDSLRAVIERTRGDITTAVLQDRLRALDRGLS